MNVIEETIDATLDSNGQLRLIHPPQLAPGPVRVTIRNIATARPQRGLADVIRAIRADQLARGFTGLTSEQLRQREAELDAENVDYDLARRGEPTIRGLGTSPGDGLARWTALGDRDGRRFPHPPRRG